MASATKAEITTLRSALMILATVARGRVSTANIRVECTATTVRTPALVRKSCVNFVVYSRRVYTVHTKKLVSAHPA